MLSVLLSSACLTITCICRNAQCDVFHSAPLQHALFHTRSDTVALPRSAVRPMHLLCFFRNSVDYEPSLHAVAYFESNFRSRIPCFSIFLPFSIPGITGFLPFPWCMQLACRKLCASSYVRNEEAFTVRPRSAELLYGKQVFKPKASRPPRKSRAPNRFYDLPISQSLFWL